MGISYQINVLDPNQRSWLAFLDTMLANANATGTYHLLRVLLAFSVLAPCVSIRLVQELLACATPVWVVSPDL
jgi:hypothetical protein